MQVNVTHSYADRMLDAYWTPPEAVHSLAQIEKLPLSILDPACGAGHILDVLSGYHRITHGSDVVGYGWPYTILRDYLAGPLVMNDVGIVTNPPYKLAQQFVKKAISETSYVAMLLRLNWAESVARLKLFRYSPPKRIHISSRRLPMMHRQGWTGPKASSNQTYAWFVWDRRNSISAQTTVYWFDWKEHVPS